MKVTLFSTHCPKCRVLELKLKQKNIPFDVIDDVNTVIKVGQDKGILSAPILKIEDRYLDFQNALAEINSL